MFKKDGKVFWGEMEDDSTYAYTFELGETAHWNAFVAIADIAVQILHQFKEHPDRGIPGSFFKDPVNVSDEDMEQAAAAWDASIDKMIRAFEGVLSEDSDTLEMNCVIDEGLLEFAAHFQSLWD